MEWDKIFEDAFEKREGASNQEIYNFHETWNTQISDLEIQSVIDTHAQTGSDIPFAPSQWSFPQKKLPSTYIEFLQYSNGGDFQRGDRYFQFFSITQFREYNVAYEFPEYMKHCVSMGMDGYGNHYIFDMREEMTDNEYPILVAHSGYLDFEGSVRVADSFLELCMGRTSMSDEMDKRWH
ncbi:SMI1/KNR4 family protein [Paenibacillus filicis]|uniref:SMI1/KNR4 family protein n=1 Tax=Paenibacillus filicis TaxID=669464 RepID=A0ABU9DVQ3_9BACL